MDKEICSGIGFFATQSELLMFLCCQLVTFLHLHCLPFHVICTSVLPISFVLRSWPLFRFFSLFRLLEGRIKSGSFHLLKLSSLPRASCDKFKGHTLSLSFTWTATQRYESKGSEDINTTSQRFYTKTDTNHCAQVVLDWLSVCTLPVSTFHRSCITHRLQ